MMNKRNLKEMILTLEDLRDYKQGLLEDWMQELLEENCEDESGFADLKNEVDALNYCIALLTNMNELLTNMEEKDYE